jgi:hypothetical protein
MITWKTAAVLCVLGLTGCAGRQIHSGADAALRVYSNAMMMASSISLPPPPMQDVVMSTVVRHGVRHHSSHHHGKAHHAMTSYSDVSQVATAEPPAEGPPATSIDLVDEVRRGLAWGNIAFSTPTAMRYGDSKQFELLLSPTETMAVLQEKLGQPDSVSAHVQVANRMKAQLTGSGFSIVEATDNIQAVSGAQVTRWAWDVTPTSKGVQHLHLILSALIDVDGQTTPLEIQTFDRDIVVNVTAYQHISEFVSSNWQWLWAAVVVPIAGLFWHKRRTRRRKPKKRT